MGKEELFIFLVLAIPIVLLLFFRLYLLYIDLRDLLESVR